MTILPTAPLPQSRMALGLVRSTLEQALWLLVFLSWLPVIGATAFDPGVLTGAVGCLEIPVPIARVLSAGPIAISDLALALAVGTVVAAAMRARALSLALVLGLAVEASRVLACGADAATATGAALGLAAAWLLLGATILSGLVFVVRGHLLSPAFAGFVALIGAEILGVALVQPYAPGWAPSAVAMVYGGFAPHPALLTGALCLAVALRVLYKMVSDNRVILLQLRVDGRIGLAFLKAIRLWLPMLGLFVVLTLGYNLMWRALDTRVGAAMIEQAGVSHPAGPTGIEGAIDHIDAEINRQWRAELEERSLAARDQADGLVRDTAAETIDVVKTSLPVRAPGTTHASCRFYDVGCHVMNLAKSIANSIYVKIRQNTLDALQARLDRAEAEAGRGSEAFRARAAQEIDAVLASYRSGSQVAIGFVFEAIRAIGLVVLLYSLLVLLKTYLIVLARVVLHPDWGLVAKLEEGAVPRSQGDTRTSSERGELWFGRNRRDVLHVARTIPVIGAPSGGRIPKPFTALLPRLFNRVWRMQRINLAACSDAVALTVAPPSCLVEWSLRRDERVIFSVSHLVGFGAGTRIERVISFNLASLIFGRVVNYCAVGPGVLLIRTNTGAIVSRSARGGASVRAGRAYRPGAVVARDTRAGFRIVSDHADVMRGNILVRKSRGDTVLIDPEAERGAAGGFGILRYARTFLLPI